VAFSFFIELGRNGQLECKNKGPHQSVTLCRAVAFYPMMGGDATALHMLLLSNISITSLFWDSEFGGENELFNSHVNIIA